MPLDEFLPTYDQQELHSTAVDAPPERVLAVARALSWRDVPLAQAMMALRSLPTALKHRGKPMQKERSIIEEFEAEGFALLAERPDELVLGGVGSFWKPSGGVRRVRAEEFRSFHEPGVVKAAFNFLVWERDGRTVLSTETRILATDETARRSFRRYWRVVHPGSALIRRVWLRAIRRRAER
jgi:hypothetical protein